MQDKPQILPTVLGCETVARSRLFRIEQLDLRFANGAEVRYERLCGSARGAVLIVAMADEDTVLLVREYAAGCGRYELGLPKGRVEHDESLEEAAERELMEEVGYGARRIRRLKSLTLAPAYFSHVTHVMLAEQLYAQRLPGDEPEEIEVVRWPLAELDTLLAREDCSEARTIAALFMVRGLLQDNNATTGDQGL